MKKKISNPADIPRDIFQYICLRWAEHLKPIRQKFINAGLAGKSVTERAPDMSLGRLNYSCSSDGIWNFDFDSRKDTGEILITYDKWEAGYRSLADENFDYWKAYEDGVFRIERSEEDAMKMAPLVPDMARAFTKAIEDAEKKFNVTLPKYPPHGRKQD
jgi:hypothetical protein